MTRDQDVAIVTSPYHRDCPLAGSLAAELRSARRELTARWLERIAERVSLDPNRLFPTEELLDHVPLLIDGIADYLENPAREIGTDTPVVGKAMELGQLRHAQGFDAYEIMKEYEILGGILFNHLIEVADRMEEPCGKGELLACGHRLFQAVSVIQQTTTMHFLRLADERVSEREDRLRAFNRAVSHEIKNRIGAVLGASDVMRDVPDLSPEQRDRFVRIVAENAHELRHTVENLLALSRVSAEDARQHRHVHFLEAAREAKRSVRNAAEAAGVEIRIADEMPDIEVNAAAVELCLTNYLTNAIKYRDGAKAASVVEIDARVERTPAGATEVVVRVRDNGLGVPVDKRDRLFERFFRAHTTVTKAEGTGLGLSIVRETVEAFGGRAWAEFPDAGAVFAFSLPYRRESSSDRQQSDAEQARAPAAAVAPIR